MALTRHVRRGGFTLVELLVVIAIIGVLVGLLIPSVQQVREAARRTNCLSNLRQMGIATQSYYSSFQHYPAGCNLDTGVSWQAYILPNLEQLSVADQLEFRDSFVWSSGVGEEAVSTFYPIFRCPADPVPKFIRSHGAILPERVPSSYISVSSGTIPSTASDNTYRSLEFNGSNQALCESMRSGVLTATQGNFQVKLISDDVSDGASNTVMIGESIFDTSLPISGGSLDSDHWCVGSYQIDFRGGTTGTNASASAQDESEVMGSTGVPLNFYHATKNFPSISSLEGEQISFSFGSWHAGNIGNFVFVDGSTQILNGDIDPTVYSNLGRRNDGNLTGGF